MGRRHHPAATGARLDHRPYASDDELQAGGQTIVYALHESIGHLGIFVSGQVATKEHDKFINCMEAFELLPPGLFQATIVELAADAPNRDLVVGRYLLRFEPRRLDDIRALGGNDAADERRFSAVARVSEINKALYHAFLAPTARAFSNAATAELLRRTDRNRLRFSLFSSQNPFMAQVGPLAEAVRAHRAPVPPDNFWLAGETLFSEAIESALTETVFLSVYGAPLLQALVGLDPTEDRPRRTAARDLARAAAMSRQRAEAAEGLDQGGLLEAGFRADLRLPRPARDRRARLCRTHEAA